MNKTIVYVDGFNLFYRLKGTPYKWLNLYKLAKIILHSECDIVGINYYTARVSGRTDPNSPRNQQVYLNALSNIPTLQTFFGNFRVDNKLMYLYKPLTFKPDSNAISITPEPNFVKVVKTEEKGSDVNLGVHLVRDALTGKFEQAAVITNDTDLAEPLRIITEELGLPVTLIYPAKHCAKSLQAVSTYQRKIKNNDLIKSQFENPVIDKNGINIYKPDSW